MELGTSVRPPLIYSKILLEKRTASKYVSNDYFADFENIEQFPTFGRG